LLCKCVFASHITSTAPASEDNETKLNNQNNGDSHNGNLNQKTNHIPRVKIYYPPNPPQYQPPISPQYQHPSPPPNPPPNPLPNPLPNPPPNPPQYKPPNLPQNQFLSGSPEYDYDHKISNNEYQSLNHQGFIHDHNNYDFHYQNSDNYKPRKKSFQKQFKIDQKQEYGSQRSHEYNKQFVNYENHYNQHYNQRNSQSSAILAENIYYCEGHSKFEIREFYVSQNINYDCRDKNLEIYFKHLNEFGEYIDTVAYLSPGKTKCLLYNQEKSLECPKLRRY